MKNYTILVLGAVWSLFSTPVFAGSVCSGQSASTVVPFTPAGISSSSGVASNPASAQPDTRKKLISTHASPALKKVLAGVSDSDGVASVISQALGDSPRVRLPVSSRRNSGVAVAASYPVDGGGIFADLKCACAEGDCSRGLPDSSDIFFLDMSRVKDARDLLDTSRYVDLWRQLCVLIGLLRDGEARSPYGLYPFRAKILECKKRLRKTWSRIVERKSTVSQERVAEYSRALNTVVQHYASCCVIYHRVMLLVEMLGMGKPLAPRLNRPFINVYRGDGPLPMLGKIQCPECELWFASRDMNLAGCCPCGHNLVDPESKHFAKRCVFLHRMAALLHLIEQQNACGLECIERLPSLDAHF